MSTILKALRRLEEEKQAQAMERDLREAVAGNRHRPPRSGAAWLRGVLVGATAAGVLVLLVGLGWMWLGPEADATSVAAAPSAAVQARTAPIPASPPPSTRSPAATPRRDPVTGPDLVSRAVPETTRTSAPPVRRPPEPSPPRVSAPPPTPAAPTGEAVPEVAVIAVKDLPVASPPAARPEPVAPDPGTARVVRLSRREVPAPRVDRTVWHPQPDRRSALVTLAGESDPREIREGEAVGGFTVVEIKPEGVTFRRDGVSFERGVGEH